NLLVVSLTGTGGIDEPLFAWKNGAAAPLPRYEAQGLAVNGLLYVFGGFFSNAITATSQAHVYDPAADLWSPLSDMPEPLTHAGQAADGPTVYLAGGFVGDNPGGSTDHVWVYDTATDFWMPGPSLPADRGGGGLVRLGRELHYFSGATRTAGVDVLTDFGDHWVLGLGPSDSPFDDDFAWTAAASLPNPRNHMGAAAVGGLAYAIGGQAGTNEFSGNQASTHAYDPASDTWTQVADLPKPLGHITASGFVMNGRIVVTGGVINNGITADVVEYDPASDTWVALPDLPAARQSPVSGIIGDQMVVNGGLGGAIETTTWFGVLADKWDRPALLSVPLGEVAGGVIDGKIYLVGEGDPVTLAFDLSTGIWGSATANVTRPFAGHHHAAEVLGGELYLLGGLGASSEGAVQVYDPVADLWRVGSPAPFAAGSSASAVIGGKIYLVGGIVGSSTTDQTAVYDPVADIWSSLAPMPLGVNHAAAGTDGARLYIFGGRSGGNTVGNGFDVVQIFDPATGLWDSSAEPGSTLAPLPQARGGTGKAVFFNGEFYVLGGETLNGAGATADRVYDRVDIYDPVADTWRNGTAMPTARHGIFPLLHAGRVYVLGGGVAAGNSQSVVNETFNPGFEIVNVIDELLSSTTNLDFGDIQVGTTASQPIVLTHGGGAGAPDIVVQTTVISGPDAADFSDDFDDAAGVTLAPGQSTTVTVSFTPSAAGPAAASLEISHSGSNNLLVVS
ncbi:MAG: kelch repeat-containing protein, partial [Alphaproteobacteria bacterium]